MTELERAKELIAKAQNVMACSHINPDGDTLGSMLGMYHVLTAAGKYVQRACHKTTPPQFYFLPGQEGVGPAIPERPWDLIMCSDASQINRFGSVWENHQELFERVP